VERVIRSAEVSYIVHATEDGDRILTAVCEKLGIEGTHSQETLTGHHSNPITRVKLHATGDEAARVLRSITDGLSPDSKQLVRRDIESMIDEHSALYLRFDKQGLIRGDLAMSSTDTVRVKLKPRLHSLKETGKEFFLKALTSG
jgi:RNA binding exosome subunit